MEEILQDNPYNHPELSIIFSEEKKKKIPYKYIQAIYLIYHPNSQLYSLPLKDKISIVEKDFLQDTFIPLNYESTIDKFKKLVLTKAQRSLTNWEDKLEERDAFMASISYDEGTYEMLDKMMMQTSKMWDQYHAILKIFNEEAQTQVRGNVEESLVEKGVV